MTAARSILRATIQRVLQGGDITREELDRAILDPLGLGRIEKEAWQALSHWADDDDVREKDTVYAAYKRERMQRLLDALVE